MFTIRNEQFDAFDRQGRSGFLDALVPILKEGNDNYDIPDAEVRQEIEALAVQAESFGLRELENIGLFIVVANDIGHDFWDVFTAPYEILTSTTLDEETKATWLDKWHDSLTAPKADDDNEADEDDPQLTDEPTE